MVSLEPIFFLSSVEALLGVLATILVLLILSDDSNFIYRRLRHYADLTLERIEQDRTEIERLVTKIGNNPQLNTLKKRRSTFKGLDRLTLDNILFSANNIQTNFRRETYDKLKDKMDIIREADEIIHSPFYFILYIVLLFLVEITGEHFPVLDSFLFSFLIVFTILTITFWIYKWRRFYTRTLSKSSISIEEIPFGVVSRSTKKLVFSCIHSISYFTFISGIILLIGRFIFHSFVLPEWVETLSILAIPIVPFLLIGYSKVNAEQQFPHSSYASLLSHFSTILICTLLYDILLYLFFQPFGTPMLNTYWFSLMAILSILGFGMAMTFYIPYCRIKPVCMEARDTSRHLLMEMKSKYTEQEQKISALSAKLK
ncbi:MAG: hypothetical protein HDS67_05440 [Bacteroidales bacterium]|nr:hypothetical protein [Bacteroidales bacterium]